MKLYSFTNWVFNYICSHDTITRSEASDGSLERPGLIKDVKVVLVGPAKSGKTALVQRYVNDTFLDVSILINYCFSK